MASFGPLNEKTNASYTCALVDETGALVPLSALTTLTLTLTDKATNTVINGRNGQNVLGVNNVTVYETLQTDPRTGKQFNLAWAIQPADQAIVTSALDVETHIALFQATWAAGSKALNFEVTLLVKNLGMVT